MQEELVSLGTQRVPVVAAAAEKDGAPPLPNDAGGNDPMNVDDDEEEDGAAALPTLVQGSMHLLPEGIHFITKNDRCRRSLCAFGFIGKFLLVMRMRLSGGSRAFGCWFYWAFFGSLTSKDRISCISQTMASLVERRWERVAHGERDHRSDGSHRDLH